MSSISSTTPSQPSSWKAEPFHSAENKDSGVARYYDAQANIEHSRLVSNRVEFEISLRTILAHLPQSNSKDGHKLKAGLKIADIGGGTGRYAVELAKLGHNVTLLDISQAELDVAAQYANSERVELEGIHVADASHLFTTCPSLLSQLGTFDAVLLLGPLYHLLEEGERINAVGDATRLLKLCPNEDSESGGEECGGGGVLFASFLTTFGHLRGVARNDPGRLARERWWYRDYLGLGGRGPGEGAGENKGRYTRRRVEGVVSYHVHPSEIRGLFEKVRLDLDFENQPSSSGPDLAMQGMGLALQVQKVVACEAFLGAELARSLNGIGEEEWRAWMDVLEKFASEDCMLSSSEHLLAVARVVDLGADGEKGKKKGI
ncbi:S-adenosyl-L-methionine-dependent methyltransferase [Cadophora sp. MPI-SDFR-AT-0126]|nr:S-adenosyl-L-methionine-dependent methyltransferase [Leotiomycetes sp. MPI-SDFR-AT-0126]